MSNIEKIRREKLIRQAEGYLDLILCLEDTWTLSSELGNSVADKALDSLNRLDANSGRRSHAEFLRGQAYRIRGDYQESILAFQKSLETDSENVHSYLGLAWCHKRIGEIPAAIEALEQAVELQPDNPVISFNLACYWSLAGNVENCCTYLNRAIELNEAFREFVENEPDFDLVRQHPQFLSIVSAIA